MKVSNVATSPIIRLQHCFIRLRSYLSNEFLLEPFDVKKNKQIAGKLIEEETSHFAV